MGPDLEGKTVSLHAPSPQSRPLLLSTARGKVEGPLSLTPPTAGWEGQGTSSPGLGDGLSSCCTRGFLSPEMAQFTDKPRPDTPFQTFYLSS